jgi:hypothetical protein
VDWDRDAFDREFRRALGFLRERCDRLLAVTAPLDLGRPPAGAKVQDMNRVIETAAGQTGALLLDLRDLAGRNLVMADHVHPTAFGQIAMAERALAVLERDGMAVRTRPSELIEYRITRWKRLRADVTYAYRHGKVSARAAVIRALAALLAACGRR